MARVMLVALMMMAKVVMIRCGRGADGLMVVMVVMVLMVLMVMVLMVVMVLMG